MIIGVLLDWEAKRCPKSPVLPAVLSFRCSHWPLHSNKLPHWNRPRFSSYQASLAFSFFCLAFAQLGSIDPRHRAALLSACAFSSSRLA